MPPAKRRDGEGASEQQTAQETALIEQLTELNKRAAVAEREKEAEWEMRLRSEDDARNKDLLTRAAHEQALQSNFALTAQRQRVAELEERLRARGQGGL